MYNFTIRLSMTTDRLFVILLVMLIPMTGCFGAVGDADAQDETTFTTNDVEMFSVGGMYSEADLPADENNYRWPYNFTTLSGDFVKIHYLDIDNVGMVNIISNCADGSTVSFQSTSSYDYLYGSHTNCTHSVRFLGGTSPFGFSLVYSLHETTVLESNSD